MTDQAAQTTGLKVGTSVAAGYFDIGANALASGILSGDDLCLIAGTWSINEFLSKEVPNALKDKKNTVTLSYLPDYYIMEEATPTSASNFNWFFETILYPGQEGRERKKSYAECDALVAAVDPEDSAAIFVPYLYGSATTLTARL